MAVIVDGREIVLTGTVGELFWDDCFTYGDVVFALATIGRDQDVVVRINSGGGVATEGSAIHAALSAHKGRKTIVVEGVAASAASVIAMAGDEVIMAAGAVLMIHDPSGLTLGTASDHQTMIGQLNALADAMAGIYADRTGRSVEECRAEMRDETWMTAAEAVAAGYADRTASDEPAEDEPEPTPFDYRLYQHPPERIVAMADQRAWNRRARTAATAVSPRHKETSMATQTAGNEPAKKIDDTNVVRIDEARAEGRSHALAYVKQIRAICALAGKPEAADDFIEKDTAPEAVTKALLDQRVEAEKASHIAGQHGAPSTASAPKAGSAAASMKRMLNIKEA